MIIKYAFIFFNTFSLILFFLPYLLSDFITHSQSKPLHPLFFPLIPTSHAYKIEPFQLLLQWRNELPTMALNERAEFSLWESNNNNNNCKCKLNNCEFRDIFPQHAEFSTKIISQV